MSKEEIEIMNIFRNFKLGNSYFRDVIVKTREEIEEFNRLHITDLDSIIRHEKIGRFSDFILTHYYSATEKVVQKDGSTEFKTELLVLKMQDFKTIVEAAICQLSENQIRKIKEGSTINQVIVEKHFREEQK